MLLIGFVLSFIIGLGFLCFGVFPFYALSSFKKKKTLSTQIDNMTYVVGEVRHVSQFTWLKFVPKVKFTFKVNDVEFSSERVYFMGVDEFERVEHARKKIDQISLLQTVFVDPRHIDQSFLIMGLSESKRKSSIGLVASGILLLLVSIAFLWVDQALEL